MSYPDLWDVVILAGVPLAVIGLVFALVYLSGGNAKRYRPGRPYNFAPVWFLARPEESAGTAGDRAALAAAHSDRLGGVTGGASDSW